MLSQYLFAVKSFFFEDHSNWAYAFGAGVLNIWLTMQQILILFSGYYW